MNFQVKKINITNINAVFKVTKILFECGKDMYKKYGLSPLA